MSKLVPKLRIHLKISIFRDGGNIPKYQNAGILKRIYYWRSPDYTKTEDGKQLSFNNAYAMARKNNDKDFWWTDNKGNRNIYSTEYATPNPETGLNYKYHVDQNLYKTRFKEKDYKKFADVMTPIFRIALELLGLPVTNLNNLVRLAAIESNYGTNARGNQGYNLGGIKWIKGTRGEKYKKTLHSDGNYYIDFNNLMDYANYKVWLLHNTYNAFLAKDTKDFVDRLHGKNPSRKSYSSNPEGYLHMLTHTSSLDKYLNPKYE